MAVMNWQQGAETLVSEVQSGQIIEVYPGKFLQIWRIDDNSVNFPTIFRNLLLSDGLSIRFDDIENDTVRIVTDNIYTP